MMLKVIAPINEYNTARTLKFVLGQCFLTDSISAKTSVKLGPYIGKRFCCIVSLMVRDHPKYDTKVRLTISGPSLSDLLAEIISVSTD